MLFNVIGYSNEVIGQVEASDVVEAWSEADKRFNNILDVREVEEAVTEQHKRWVKCCMKGCELEATAVLISRGGEWVGICQQHLEDLLKTVPELKYKGESEFAGSIMSIYGTPDTPMFTRRE